MSARGNGDWTPDREPEQLPGMSQTRHLIALFLAHLAARSLSAATIKRRTTSLGSFGRWMAPASITTATGPDVEEWLSTFAAARTRAAYRADLAAFFRWAQRRQVVERSPVTDTDPIRVPRSLPRPIPPALVPGIVAAAPMPLRLGLALAAYAGLRRAEIVAVTSSDVQLSPEPVIAVRNGKGGKDRIVPLHPVLVEMLADVRADGSRLVPMGYDVLGRAAAEHLERMGVGGTLHQLRHSFGTEMARVLRGNLIAVGALMGHDSPSTTQGYVGWGGGETAAAVREAFAA